MVVPLLTGESAFLQFYPHCIECSNWQGTAVKLDRKHLINHLTSGGRLRVWRWHFAGALVGFMAPQLHSWAGHAGATDGALGWAEVATKDLAIASKR